jgi:hypothetical protein
LTGGTIAAIFKAAIGVNHGKSIELEPVRPPRPAGVRIGARRLKRVDFAGNRRRQMAGGAG